MRDLIYRRSVKALLFLLQAAAAGILCYCLLNAAFWLDGSDSIREAAGGFEESDLFFEQVDAIVRNKIKGQQNSELFETDEVFDGEKEIDIQSYGKGNASVKDMNTTYRLKDLLQFGSDGSLERMEAAISKAVSEAAGGGLAAGERLDLQAGTLETILPVTGISLAECSRWYSDSAGFVLNIYRTLAQTARDIRERYSEYRTLQEESWSRYAPSNLRYCIENTVTGELYTNLEAEDYDSAVRRLSQEEGFVNLYEGERSFNIMVANPDNVLNEEAADWFMMNRFVNTNEKVLLAFNPDWPVSDELKTYASFYVQRGDILLASAVLGTGSALVLLAGFLLTMLGAGIDRKGGKVRLYRADAVPAELTICIYLCFAVVFAVWTMSLIPEKNTILSADRNLVSLTAAAGYLVILSGAASFARRIKSRTLWSNSICHMLLHSWKQVTSSRIRSWHFLMLYLVFFALNFLFLVFFKTVGVFFVLVLDMLVLLYLLRDLVGKQSVWEGIHQISTGDLTYKIDTSTLQGETYEMARAINDMGDGLQEAVQAIVKNERLKAELITNVSHDLKTPLTSIVNYVDLLKRENPEGEKVRHYIEVLEQKSQRLKQLTEDLVEASRISSGNVELDIMRLQFSSILEQAYGEFQERFEERNLTAAWELETRPLYIMADGAQLWRVLENLMGNICKYAKEGTEIRIALKVQDGEAKLSLQNTSAQEIEIEADELTGRFVRGDRSRSTEGSGLGLSIAQNLTQLMGGKFKVRTDGTLFETSVSFPLAPPAADA